MTNFEIKQTGAKHFGKKTEVQHTYQIKLDDEWTGSKLIDVENDLRTVLHEGLKTSRGDAKDTDLANLIVQNKGLEDIAITLRPWSELNEDVVLEGITKVLQSHKDLPIDKGFQITVGSIEIPSGSGRTKGFTLSGVDSCIRLKTKSFYEICNEDVACLYLAVTAAWIASLQVVTPHEWRQLCHMENLENQSLFQKLLKTNSIFKQLKLDLLQKGSVKNLKPVAVELCEQAGQDYYTQGSYHSLPPMEVILGADISVLEACQGNKVVRVGTGYTKSLYLYSITQMVDQQKQTHFHAIRNIQGVFNDAEFCKDCMKPHGRNKTCSFKCFICKTKECETRPKLQQFCLDCNNLFPNKECFTHHLKPSAKGSRCSLIFKCPTCQQITARLNKDRTPHVCYTSRCTFCQKIVPPDHLCYNRSIDPQDTEKFKYIFFDFETRQDEKYTCAQGYNPENHDIDCTTCSGFTSLCLKCSRCANCNDSNCGTSQHIVNYVNIQTVCQQCVQDNSPISQAKCSNCGNKCADCEQKKENNACCQSCGYREVIFKGADTLQNFCQWLFTKGHQGAKVFSHNGQGFDNHFILRHMLTKGEDMKVIYRGSKIMTMSKDKITFIDSSNFFMMPLAALPKAFGLNEDTSKLAFPHFFNTIQNQDYIGVFPDPEYYGVDDFSETKKEEFLKWHADKKDSVFDFKAEMESYCRMDTSILRQAMVKFRQLFVGLCDIDPPSQQ